MNNLTELNITFTLPVINFNNADFLNSINDVLEPVKQLGDNLNKDVLTSTLANLRKFQKQISDRRIIIAKEIKAPITEFEKQIKEGDAQIESYITKYNEQLQSIVTREKAEKLAGIQSIISDQLADGKLNETYARQLTVLEDYYLLKWTFSKIREDVAKRADDLFKQQDYERIQQELKNTQIESRTRLIESLNKKHHQNYTYARFPLETFNDVEVEAFFTTLEQIQTPEVKEVVTPDLELEKDVDYVDYEFVNEEGENILITLVEYNKLYEDSRILNALIEAGVDNWSGYSAAMEALEEECPF